MNADLQRLGDEYWAFSLASEPTSASLRGIHDYDAELEDLSRGTEDEHIAALDGFASAAETIDPATLTADERVSREVLMFETSTKADELRSRMAEFAVDPFNGIQVVYQQLAGQIPITAPAHAEAALEKWSKMGLLVDQAIGRLRQGLARDRTPPVVGTGKALAQVEAYLSSPVETDAFVNLRAPLSWNEIQVAAWRDRLASVVTTVVRPAFERYRAAISDEVMPKARPEDRSGVVWLSDGDEVYARAIRRHTSLDRTPLEIHRAGLDDISALEVEYAALGIPVLNIDHVPTIFERLRSDEDLRFVGCGRRGRCSPGSHGSGGGGDAPVVRNPAKGPMCHGTDAARRRRRRAPCVLPAPGRGWFEAGNLLREHDRANHTHPIRVGGAGIP